MAQSSEPTSRPRAADGRRVAPRSRDEGASSPRAPAGRRPAVEVIRTAGQQFRELAGMEPQSVTALESRDEGWMIEFEVTELERIPPSTSVLAAYQVELSPSGDIQAYRRIRRYHRNQVDDA